MRAPTVGMSLVRFSIWRQRAHLGDLGRPFRDERMSCPCGRLTVSQSIRSTRADVQQPCSDRITRRPITARVPGDGRRMIEVKTLRLPTPGIARAAALGSSRCRTGLAGIALQSMAAALETCGADMLVPPT
jgi:hypothetical protein